jgi:uncharacterized protein YcbX
MAITVTALSTTPVKGTRIRTVDSVQLGPEGAVGDRAFYIVDARGAMVNGKRLAILQTVVADYRPDEERLRLTFPDGIELAAPVRLGPPVETTFFGDARDARELDGPLSAALSRYAGQSLRLVRAGSAVDRGAEGAVSLVSRASLQRLAVADSGEPVDPRRFRMLIEIDGVDAHVEDRWIDRELVVGEARLRMRGHVGRCVTTTRGPDTGEVDYPTLKLLATYRLDEPTTEPLAFGVHGEVVVGGLVRIGDEVRLRPGEDG